MKTYLALGDSMSIDTYTGVVGGGSVQQLFKSLGAGWTLDDQAFDGCTIRQVPVDRRGELITITIGGNDLRQKFGFLLQTKGMEIPARQAAHVLEELEQIATSHRALLQAVRRTNPHSTMIVANIYAPQTPLAAGLATLLDRLNAALAGNMALVGAHLADVRSAFRGHEHSMLCRDIEPALPGATAMARLFRAVVPADRVAGPGGAVSR